MHNRQMETNCSLNDPLSHGLGRESSPKGGAKCCSAPTCLSLWERWLAFRRDGEGSTNYNLSFSMITQSRGRVMRPLLEIT